MKKSESTAAMRFQGFQRAHCGTHTRGEIPEFFYVILAVAVPIVIKNISNKVILRANSRKNMSAEDK